MRSVFLFLSFLLSPSLLFYYLLFLFHAHSLPFSIRNPFTTQYLIPRKASRTRNIIPSFLPDHSPLILSRIFPIPKLVYRTILHPHINSRSSKLKVFCLTFLQKSKGQRFLGLCPLLFGILSSAYAVLILHHNRSSFSYRRRG